MYTFMLSDSSGRSSRSTPDVEEDAEEQVLGAGPEWLEKQYAKIAAAVAANDWVNVAECLRALERRVDHHDRFVCTVWPRLDTLLSETLDRIDKDKPAQKAMRPQQFKSYTSVRMSRRIWRSAANILPPTGQWPQRETTTIVPRAAPPLPDSDSDSDAVDQIVRYVDQDNWPAIDDVCDRFARASADAFPAEGLPLLLGVLASPIKARFASPDLLAACDHRCFRALITTRAWLAGQSLDFARAFTCSECAMPLGDVYYHCAECRHVTLCAACEAREKDAHPLAHALFKIRLKD